MFNEFWLIVQQEVINILLIECYVYILLALIFPLEKKDITSQWLVILCKLH